MSIFVFFSWCVLITWIAVNIRCDIYVNTIIKSKEETIDLFKLIPLPQLYIILDKTYYALTFSNFYALV